MALRQLDEDLWVTESPLRFGGLEVGARMTVIRLPGARLLLHSPIDPTPELLTEVQALGTVAFLVAPNKFHHLFVGKWKDACPDASMHLAPGLDRKRPDLKGGAVLGDEAKEGWAETVDQVFVQGFALANEVVFFHRPSATLLTTDLVFNIGASSPASTRLAFRLIGTSGALGPTLLEKLFVRDRPAFRRCLERILEWPFERIVMAHGDVCEHGGREQFVSGYAWVLGD